MAVHKGKYGTRASSCPLKTTLTPQAAWQDAQAGLYRDLGQQLNRDTALCGNPDGVIFGFQADSADRESRHTTRLWSRIERWPVRTGSMRDESLSYPLMSAAVRTAVSGKDEAQENQKWLPWTTDFSWLPFKGPSTAWPRMFHVDPDS